MQIWWLYHDSHWWLKFSRNVQVRIMKHTQTHWCSADLQLQASLLEGFTKPQLFTFREVTGLENQGPGLHLVLSVPAGGSWEKVKGVIRKSLSSHTKQVEGFHQRWGKRRGAARRTRRKMFERTPGSILTIFSGVCIINSGFCCNSLLLQVVLTVAVTRNSSYNTPPPLHPHCQ